MAFVNVKLIDPDGKRYNVQIDPEMSAETVKAQLVQRLKLEGERKYRLLLVDSLVLSTGNELRLVAEEEHAVGHLEPADDQ
jgi:hypothetical protein